MPSAAMGEVKSMRVASGSTPVTVRKSMASAFFSFQSLLKVFGKAGALDDHI